MQIGNSFIKPNLIKIPLHTLLREANKQMRVWEIWHGNIIINTSLISQQQRCVDYCHAAGHMSLKTDSNWIMCNLLVLHSTHKANDIQMISPV